MAEQRKAPMSRRRLLAMIGTAAGSSAMYQAMTTLGFAAESTYKGPIRLEGDPKGASVLVLGAGVAGLVAALLVLRMDLRTILDRLHQAVLRWQCGKLVSIRAVEHVSAGVRLVLDWAGSAHGWGVAFGHLALITLAPGPATRPRSCPDALVTCSARHHALVQSRDRVERGQNGTLLPGRKVGGVLTGESNSPVDVAQVLVMLLARFLGPPAEAAEHPGDPVPADRYAVLVVAGLFCRVASVQGTGCRPWLPPPPMWGGAYAGHRCQIFRGRKIVAAAPAKQASPQVPKLRVQAVRCDVPPN
jgi:hypothetical protein